MPPWDTNFLSSLSGLLKLISLVLSLLCWISSGETATLTGTVADRTTGRPIPFVHLLIPQLKRDVLTDLHGDFVFQNLPEGSWSLRVSFPGYSIYQDTVSIQTDTGLDRFILLSTDPAVQSARLHSAPLDTLLEGLSRRLHEKIFHARYPSLQSHRFTSHGTQILYAGKDAQSAILARIEFTGEGYYRNPDTLVQVITGYRAHGLAGQGFGMHPGVVVNIQKGYMNGQDFDTGPLPIAPKAPKQYHYTLTDRIKIGDHLVYHLSIRPKKNSRPALEGDIWISGADYALVGYDLQFNRALLKKLNIKALRTYQESALYYDRYWLPIHQIVQIQTASNNLAEQITHLDGYELNRTISDSVLAGKPLTFHPLARIRPPTYWSAHTDSLRVAEQKALHRLMQSEHLPHGWKRVIEQPRP